jgi:hypothetical protein
MHIDPAGAQLLFVDLQTFLTSASATERADMIGKAAGALARTATALGMPITSSLVPGADTSPQPVPELQGFATTANVFVRQSASAFIDPALRGILSRHSRKTLVIAGFLGGSRRVARRPRRDRGGISGLCGRRCNRRPFTPHRAGGTESARTCRHKIYLGNKLALKLRA